MDIWNKAVGYNEHKMCFQHIEQRLCFFKNTDDRIHKMWQLKSDKLSYAHSNVETI